MLESKWGTIRLNVSNFISSYEEIVALNIYGVYEDDIFLKAFGQFKLKSHNKPFVHKHCWLLLHIFPRWNNGHIVAIGGQKRKDMEVLTRGA